ncbi:MAG: chromosome segregation protein SMC [Acidobacteria bacterium]|nr:MAG: chromosome segregation protein SMC [Acidobacteriota bacterium]
MGGFAENMYVIRKLRLFGFKSFPRETVIRFSPGITGIVGPNGCGKSNIADALLWVMGEQSFKNLRGGAMEDVVFNGSDKLAPMGMAEVELQLENLNPDEGEERLITIQRQYFREGDAKYRLNGKRVRLKDIQEFLLEIGLGSKSFAIIEQGRVSTLINARPEERRRMIEEAAGILKYKMKKKEAVGKIRLTEENLERVEDIIAEVKRGLNSLRQQAGRARQFKVIQDKLREKKEGYLGHLGFQFQQELDGFRSQKGKFQDEFAAMVAERGRLEAKLEEQKRKILNSEEAAAALNRTYFEKKLQSERLEAEISHLQGKIQELETRLAGYGEQFARIEKELAESDETAKREKRNLELASEDLENLEVKKEEMQAALDRMKAELSDAETAFRDADRGLKESEGRHFTLSSEISFTRKAIEELKADIKGKQGVVDIISKETAEISNRIQRKEKEIERFNEEIEVLNREKEDLDAAIAGRKQELEARREELRGLEIEIATVEKHMESMRHFLEERQGFSENVKALMEKKPELIAGVLGDFIETDGEIDAALEAFFSGFYQVLIPRSKEALLELIETARGDGLNGVSFLVPDDSRSKEAGGGLLSHLKWKESVSGRISEYLSNVAVRAGVSEGMAVAGSFLTGDGDFFLAETGILTLGHKDEHGFFSIKTGLRESEEKLKTLYKKRDGMKTEAESLTDALETLTVRREDLLSKQEALKLDLSASRSSLASARQMLASKDADTKRISEEIAARSMKLEGLKKNYAGAEKEIAVLEEKITAQMDVRRRRERELSLLREKLESHGEAFTELKLLHEKRAATTLSIEKELKFLEIRQGELRESLEQARKNRSLDMENLDSLRERLENARKNADLAVDEYRKIDNLLSEKKREVEGERQTLALFEEELKEQRQQENNHRDKEQELELKMMEIQGEFNRILSQLDELLQGDSRPELVAVEEPEALKAEVEKLEKRLAGFGVVNLLAIDECETQEERFNYLTEQREDLMKSIANLTRDIHEIDNTTRELFMHAYDAINTTFSQVFQHLFGGGNASLSLTDPADPLETGVDIFAQPPGKKIQNISLMSGGEKAQTALALLFAMFEYRTSPLCVLDEVDAPLDEANVIQLGQFLRRYRDTVQFVVMTHNKTTMEMVDSLYGVTMEEPGCSKMLSVKLEDSATL